MADPIKTSIEIEFAEAQKEWTEFETRIRRGTNIKLEFDRRSIQQIGKQVQDAFLVDPVSFQADKGDLKRFESDVKKSASKAGDSLESELKQGTAGLGGTIEFEAELVGVEAAADDAAEAFEDAADSGRFAGLGGRLGERVTDGLTSKFSTGGKLEQGLASGLASAGAAAGPVGAAVAVGAALALGIAKGFQVGLERADLDLRNQLLFNLSDAEAEALGEQTGAIFGNGIVSASRQEIQGARSEIEALLGDFSPASQISALTEEFLFASELLGADVETLIQQAQRFVTVGIAEDAGAALDAITGAAATAGSRLEDTTVTIVEFGPVLREFGLDAQDAFAVIEDGFESGLFAGADAGDRVAQLFQDFGDRLQAGGSKEAIEELGLSYTGLVELLNAGQGEQALQLVSDALLGFDDQARASALSSEVFGAVFDEAIDDRALLQWTSSLTTVTDSVGELEDFSDDLAEYSDSAAVQVRRFQRTIEESAGLFGDLVFNVFSGGDFEQSDEIAQRLGDTLNGVVESAFNAVVEFADFRSTGGVERLAATFFDALFGTFDERAALAGLDVLTAFIEPIESGLNGIANLIPGFDNVDLSGFADEARRQIEADLESELSRRRDPIPVISVASIERGLQETLVEVEPEVDRFVQAFNRSLEDASADNAVDLFGQIDVDAATTLIDSFRNVELSGGAVTLADYGDALTAVGISGRDAADAQAYLADRFAATNSLLLGQIPAIGDAVSDLEEDATLKDFLDGLLQQQLDYAAEQANINLLLESGADNLVATLSQIGDADIRTSLFADAAEAAREGNDAYLLALEIQAEDIDRISVTNESRVRQLAAASFAPINESTSALVDALNDPEAFAVSLGFDGTELYEAQADVLELQNELRELQADKTTPTIEIDAKRRELDQLVADLLVESKKTYTTNVAADVSAAQGSLDSLRADALGTVLRPPVEITPDVLALQRQVAAADLTATARVQIDTRLLQAQLNRLNLNGQLTGAGFGGFFDGGVAGPEVGLYRWKEYGLSEAIVPLERGAERAYNVVSSSGILDAIDPYLRRRYGGLVDSDGVVPVGGRQTEQVSSGVSVIDRSRTEIPITVTSAHPDATADRIQKRLLRASMARGRR